MTNKQGVLELGENQQLIKQADKYEFEPIQGYPMLNWKGKRHFRTTQYYPAQLKESYGQPVDSWMNRIYWGDNLQVMSHLLKEFRGQIKLAYIDPPFDSKAVYKKNIRLKGVQITNDQNVFEEKQYTDIWTNDEYLQFMYERLILIRELLTDEGSIFLHCDWHKSHYLRLMLDEIFGADNFRNEIIWVRSTNPKGSQHESRSFSSFTDTIFYYVKTSKAKLYLDRVRIPLSEEELLEKYHRVDNKGRFYDGPIIRSDGMGARPYLVYKYKGYTPGPSGWRMKKESLEKLDRDGDLGWSNTGKPFRKLRPENDKGKPIGSFWNDISLINSQADERIGYPTQKPEKLLERIINAVTDSGDIVFDCFMGSGTTQAVSLKLGRRFLGADINLGSIQITTNRLLNTISLSSDAKIETQESLFTDDEDEDKSDPVSEIKFYSGFSVYNVNNYDVFRNPIEARKLLLEALEIQLLPDYDIFDGQKDGRMVKLMPVNRIATKADLSELINNLDLKLYEQRQTENPLKPVEHILLICMGHEPGLASAIEEGTGYKFDVEVVDILRDKQNIQFKRESYSKIEIVNKKLKILQFYPMNLLQKLSMQEESVDEWREMVDSIMIDWNYDGQVLRPQVLDIPEKNELVKGVYDIPDITGTIRVKITDVLSESLEVEVRNG